MQNKNSKRLIPELKKFITEYSTLTDYSKAVPFLLRSMVNLLGCESVILLGSQKIRNGLYFEKAHGFPKRIPRPVIEALDPLMQLLQHRSNVFFIDQNDRYRRLLQESTFLSRLPKGFSCRLIIKLTVNGELYGALLFAGRLHPQAASPVARALLGELGERAGVTLRHAQLMLTLKRESLEKDLLLETGRTLNSTLNLDELLELILDQLRRVVGYDKGSIFILDPRTRNIARVARRGPLPLFDQVNFLKKSEGLCTWVIKNGRPAIVDDVTADGRYYPIYLDTQSEMDVPIINRDRVLGVFNLESNRKMAFSKHDCQLVQAVAAQAAIAIDNAWLYEQLVLKREMDRELKIAKRFQRALLPKRIPQTDRFSFAAMNVPSRTVGGDLYDFINFSDGRIGIAIGDVSGKGTPGAILMATLYATYRGLIREDKPINKRIADLNNILRGRIQSSAFITFFYGELFPETGEFIYCNAGHCPPCLIRANGEHEILHEGGTVLGFLSDMTFEIGRITLQPGDLLFMYTDGITEAMSAEESGELYGEERLLGFLQEHRRQPATGLLRQIFREIRRFSGLNRLQDDFTTVVVKARAASDLSEME